MGGRLTGLAAALAGSPQALERLAKVRGRRGDCPGAGVNALRPLIPAASA